MIQIETISKLEFASLDAGRTLTWPLKLKGSSSAFAKLEVHEAIETKENADSSLFITVPVLNFWREPFAKKCL